MLQHLLIPMVVLGAPFYFQPYTAFTLQTQDVVSVASGISITSAVPETFIAVPAVKMVLPVTAITYKPADSVASLEPVVLATHITLPNIVQKVSVPDVPFYSQFTDITSEKWKKVGCGIASLAMVIEYYKPDTVMVDTLLSQGIDAGAYQSDAGWVHSGLIKLSRKYGLDGESNDFSKLSSKGALAELKKSLKDGPVIASIHYKFEPTNPIPHLVVINAVVDDVVYYNDPSAKVGNKQISTTTFLKAWKQRFIALRPVKKNELVIAL